MNAKFLSLIAFTILAAQIARADDLCQSRITYLAKEAMAAEMKADDDDIELVKYTKEEWTKKDANNHGTVVVTLIHRDFTASNKPDTYANVRMAAQQIDNSDTCMIKPSGISFAK